MKQVDLILDKYQAYFQMYVDFPVSVRLSGLVIELKIVFLNCKFMN